MNSSSTVKIAHLLYLFYYVFMIEPASKNKTTSAQEGMAGSSRLHRKLKSGMVASHRTIDMLFDDSPIQEMSRRHGLKTFFMEGYMDSAQYEWIEKLFAVESISKVVQTGFNAGHSAFAFANLGSDTVTSFDINHHPYVRPAHEYLIKRFPATNFSLILGDSLETVPAHKDEVLYDIAFIDGGHSQSVAYSDLFTMRRLVKDKSYVIMDDYGDSFPWQVGPTLAYDQAISDGLIKPMCVEHTKKSSWALGQYDD